MGEWMPSAAMRREDVVVVVSVKVILIADFVF